MAASEELLASEELAASEAGPHRAKRIRPRRRQETALPPEDLADNPAPAHDGIGIPRFPRTGNTPRNPDRARLYETVAPEIRAPEWAFLRGDDRG